MLSEKAIVKLSLIAIVLGLLGIYLTVLLTEPEGVPLSEINESLVGQVIKTGGEIKSFRLSNTSTGFIALSEGGREIQVIAFNADGSEFKTGDFVSVTGEVTKYQGKIELVAREIIPN